MITAVPKEICLLVLFLSSSSVFSQTYHFAAHGGGSKKDEFLDFKIDNAENSYVLLKYDTNVAFGDESYSHPSKNALIVKYDKDGNQLMTKNIVAEGSSLFGAIGVSGAGIVVAATGTKLGMLDTHEVYGGTFIGKLGEDGDFEWVLQPVDRIEGARQFTEFRVTAIEVTENEIYVAATANGKITLNGVTDPGYAHDNLQSALLIKMDMDGDVLWIKNIPTPGVANHPTIDGGMDHILLSADGQNVYVAGKVGNGSYNPYEVAYVAKFSTDGTFSWVKKTSSSGADSWGIAEASNGDLISGFGIGGAQLIDFGDGAELQPSSTGWYGALVRFDKDGNVQVLKYVADALYSDAGNIGATLRLYHVSVSPNDQVIILGEIGGTHAFTNDIEITSTAGMAGSSSKDAAIIISDLDFIPVEAYANTGGNNESARKGVAKGDRIYYSGEYDSYSHPYFGSFNAQFGDFTFASAGNLDIFVASVGIESLSSLPELRLNITTQANALSLFWPSTYSNVVVEFTSNLSSNSWDTLNLSPILENDQWKLTLPVNISPRFYRLR